jgi:N6-adenosine-specific RNA methylase IME4
MMNEQDAEDYTQSLGLIVAGSWRQIALAKRLGVPKALGLTTEQWVQDRLGGYVRMSVAERQEAVKNLTAEGHSLRESAEILGVSHQTVANDVNNLTPLDAVAALAADDSIRSTIEAETKKAAKEAERLAKRNGGQIEDGCKIDDLKALIAAGQKYAVIYADPPWEFKVYSGKGKQRSAERHYDTASLDDIKALPIGNLAADDCALLLWCVMPEIPGALEVIKAWGFEYKTVAFNWIKTSSLGAISAKGEGLHWGMGYWTRANSELCLLATKGSPKRQNKDVHQVVISPVEEHSRKPDEVQVRIERLLDGPYLELFARRTTPGWTVWGNDISSNLFHQHIKDFDNAVAV